MSERPEDKLAFLSSGEGPSTGPYFIPGMTLRQWYAGMALQGMAAGDHWSQNICNEKIPLEAVAKIAFKTADAMIAEAET